jgi:hypothetical protein
MPDPVDGDSRFVAAASLDIPGEVLWVDVERDRSLESRAPVIFLGEEQVRAEVASITDPVGIRVRGPLAHQIPGDPSVCPGVTEVRIDDEGRRAGDEDLAVVLHGDRGGGIVLVRTEVRS